MGWEQALRLWRSPVAADSTSARVAAERRAQMSVVRAVSLCIASGKGGTGKSIVTASLADEFGARGRTLIVDADMGVGNAHILQNTAPERSFVDVVAHRCSVAQARTVCTPTIDLVGGGSGVSQMSALNARDVARIAHGLGEVESEYDYVLVDSAAGISDQTVSFAAACDAVLIVTTPDVTAMTDAYAFIKVLHARRAELVPWLVVNRISSDDGPEHDAQHVSERISRVCEKFLALRPVMLGAIPDDRAVPRSVAQRRSVVQAAPHSNAAAALTALAREVAVRLSGVPRGGVGRRLARGLEAAE